MTLTKLPMAGTDSGAGLSLRVWGGGDRSAYATLARHLEEAVEGVQVRRLELALRCIRQARLAAMDEGFELTATGGPADG